MDVLSEICLTKRIHVEEAKKRLSYDDLREIIDRVPRPMGFCNAIRRKSREKAIIAEVKKASPSKGIIREDFDPVSIAKIYEEVGATCLSVLTDEPYFQGHDDYLVAVKQEVGLPVLRKDFMIDPYQIFESRALGADCVLLIMAVLSDSLACTLYESAIGLGLDVLVEVHNLQELERAIKLDPVMIGVNNRNLKTLEVDVGTSFELLEHIPDGCIKISESGISSKDKIDPLFDAGYQGFLIGESLMKQEDIGSALTSLL